MNIVLTVQSITNLANATSNLVLNLTAPGTLGATSGALTLNGVPTANISGVTPGQTFTASFA
jgi:hypothetical protein